MLNRARTRRSRGFSLIEVMMGFALFAILMFLAVPNFTLFMQNQQIKNAGEGVLQGLNLARMEALRRNTAVRFQFVSNLTATCALATNSLAWVVSLQDPTSKCDVPIADPANTAPPVPGSLRKQSATEGTRNVTVTTTGGSTLTFNGLGRVVGAGITQIDLGSTSGTCELTGGTMRCLRLLVSTGGQIKLCDPKVTSNTDPRYCS